MPADPLQELKDALSARYRIEEELERGGMAVIPETLDWLDGYLGPSVDR